MAALMSRLDAAAFTILRAGIDKKQLMSLYIADIDDFIGFVNHIAFN